jgi:hypothetical protein
MARGPRRRISVYFRREQGAVGLIELLVAIPLMMAVFAATLGIYDFSAREQGRGEGRVRALIDQKNGLERISRELRDAAAVEYQTSEIVDAQIVAGGRWLRYDCSGTACKRSEGPSQGSFDKGPEVVITGVQSAEFQLLAQEPGLGLQPNYIDPTYVQVTLRVSVKGANNPIVLDDGFNLRNLTTPG